MEHDPQIGPLEKLLAAFANGWVGGIAAGAVGMQPSTGRMAAVVAMAVRADPRVGPGALKSVADVLTLPGSIAVQAWRTTGPRILDAAEEVPGAVAGAAQEHVGKGDRFTVIDVDGGAA